MYRSPYIAQMEIDAGVFDKDTPGAYSIQPTGWQNMNIRGETVAEVTAGIERALPSIVNTFAPRAHFRILNVEFEAVEEDLSAHGVYCDNPRIFGSAMYDSPVAVR